MSSMCVCLQPTTSARPISSTAPVDAASPSSRCVMATTTVVTTVMRSTAVSTHLVCAYSWDLKQKNWHCVQTTMKHNCIWKKIMMDSVNSAVFTNYSFSDRDLGSRSQGGQKCKTESCVLQASCYPVQTKFCMVVRSSVHLILFAMLVCI